jgi:hypothetical protein
MNHTQRGTLGININQPLSPSKVPLCPRTFFDYALPKAIKYYNNETQGRKSQQRAEEVEPWQKNSTNRATYNIARTRHLELPQRSASHEPATR